MLSFQIPSDSVCVLVWKMQLEEGARYTETRLLCREEDENCLWEVSICGFHNLSWSCTVSPHPRDILV